MKNLNGGFSKGVVESCNWRNYVEKGAGYAFGYIGEETRTKERDIVVENALRHQGLENEGISSWLTSTSGRHMMDSVDKKTSIKNFKIHVEEYTKNVFLDVTLWAHPDHTGTLGSSMKIKTMLFNTIKYLIEKEDKTMTKELSKEEIRIILGWYIMLEGESCNETEDDQVYDKLKNLEKEK